MRTVAYIFMLLLLSFKTECGPPSARRIATPTPTAVSGITATLSTLEPTFQPGTTSSTVTITLSATRGVDTVFTLTADNGDAELMPNPVTITAGNLTVNFSVTAAAVSAPNPFNVSATAPGVVVLNSLQLEMVE